MLTLVQIAAVVLFVALVVAVVRLTRTREDAPRSTVAPAPVRAVPVRDGAGREGGLVPDRSRSRWESGAVPGRAVWYRIPDEPAPAWPGRSAAPAGRAGLARPAPAGTEPEPAGSEALDEELRDLAIRLQDRAAAIEAEREAQRLEIDQLRSALAEAAREIEALRSTGEAPPAAEPRLPNVNVYELRAQRRR